MGIGWGVGIADANRGRLWGSQCWNDDIGDMLEASSSKETARYS